MFEKARYNLTAWYLLIIMIISGSFSLAIYRVLTREVDRFVAQQKFRIERRMIFSPGPAFIVFDDELIFEVKTRIKIFLIVVNGIVFAVSGALAYILAGRTLRPISVMVEEQQRFVSDASHELKTPLTSLKSAFEVFLRDNKSSLADAKTLARESILEVDKLQRLSESMLKLSTFESLDRNVELVAVELSEVVELAFKRVEALAKKKNIQIKSHAGQVKVRGRKDDLVDLAVILLDNAIKYSGDGSTVEIRSAKTDTSGLLEVQDEGMGIDNKDKEKIFERFYRTEASRSKEGENGYGLGLAIAKKMIKANKGSIAVKSQLGKGSKFVVKLGLWNSQLKSQELSVKSHLL